MSTELETRVRRALVDIVDGMPVPATAEPVPARAGRLARWRAPVLSAATAVVAVVGLVLLTGYVRFDGAGDGDGVGAPPSSPAATLPTEIAGMNPLTRPVSSHPAGTVLAAYEQGALSTRSPWTSQELVLGADGRTYRRLDLATDRGVEGDDGEWASADFLLRPDGVKAAVLAPESGIEVVDLSTGQVARYHVDTPPVIGLDWSADGRMLLFASEAEVPDGPLVTSLLDTATGAVRRFEGRPCGSASYSGASFAPDGSTFATRVATPEGCAVVVADLTGAVVRVVADYGRDGGPGPGVGRAAWSPDGALLALETGTRTITFVDATGTGAAVPAPVTVNRPDGVQRLDVVGWRSPDTMVVSVVRDDGELDVLQVPVDGGGQRRLSHLGSGVLGLARPGSIQFAETLLESLRVRPGSPAERGPWPWQLRFTLMAGAVTAGVVGLLIRRRLITRQRDDSRAMEDRGRRRP